MIRPCARRARRDSGLIIVTVRVAMTTRDANGGACGYRSVPAEVCGKDQPDERPDLPGASTASAILPAVGKLAPASCLTR